MLPPTTDLDNLLLLLTSGSYDKRKLWDIGLTHSKEVKKKEGESVLLLQYKPDFFWLW